MPGLEKGDKGLGVSTVHFTKGDGKKVLQKTGGWWSHQKKLLILSEREKWGTGRGKSLCCFGVKI